MHQTLTYKVYEKQNPVFVILTSVYFGISVCRVGGREIYGTAHNSVVRKPGMDEWYIVYHRINKNYLDKDKAPGVHREVCIDRMEFNADGTIQRVKVSK